METTEFFGREKISRILWKLAPPVMLAQLIQALYNIVDSLFVGRDSSGGLTALSIIYPIQLLMIALAVGAGVGVNTAMAARLGEGKREEADRFAGAATPLAAGLWFLFALVCFFLMPTYARLSTPSPEIAGEVVVYGRIVCVLSFGLFLESVWTKVLQAEGDMKTPMFAQIIGAVTNIILDPILIFGLLGLPRMGIAGAAVATVLGQMAAALVVCRRGLRRVPRAGELGALWRETFRLGLPNMLMQAAYTVYIFGLNLILATFSDQAVTVLGLYYKWQSFFFIPLGAMQTCIVPVISFNYAARRTDRCKKTLLGALIFGWAMMLLGIACFSLLPEPMLRVFSSDPEVIRIGVKAFPILGSSFLALVASLTFPVFFQAVGRGLCSSALTVVRTVVLFVPLGWLFSRAGLDWFWLTFPVTDSLTALVGWICYRRFWRKQPQPAAEEASAEPAAIRPSHPGVIVAIAREHGSGGRQTARLLAERLGVPFYDKELAALAAEKTGMAREFWDELGEAPSSRLSDLVRATSAGRAAIAAQSAIIQKIADAGSCVIVGRAADSVLRGRENLVRVFLYAPREYRVGRVMQFYGDSRAEASRQIDRADAARAAYTRAAAGHAWGERGSYDLLLDSSCGPERAAQILESYLKLR